MEAKQIAFHLSGYVESDENRLVKIQFHEEASESGVERELRLAIVAALKEWIKQGEIRLEKH
jgi:hypothetical protein